MFFINDLLVHFFAVQIEIINFLVREFIFNFSVNFYFYFTKVTFMDSKNFGSVLEQFSIIRLPLGLDFFFNLDLLEDGLDDYFEILALMFSEEYPFLTEVLSKPYAFLCSSLVLTSFSTKNYVYGRIMIFSFKCYFRLLSSSKLYIFFRTNPQVLKVKILLKFQEMIKANFGGHYPFSTRLLNFYPYLLVIFFLIFLHNFNGLLFYGSLILHFYYKILYYLFNLLLD